MALTATEALSKKRRKGAAPPTPAGAVAALPVFRQSLAAGLVGGDVVAHRNGGAASSGGFYAGPYPEETVEGIRAAIAAGCTRINAHVRATADGALILMHDNTPDRTTDATGSVLISNWSSQGIRKLKVDPSNVADWPGYGVDWGDQRVPFLEDVLKEFGGKVLLVLEATSGGWQSAGYVGDRITAMVKKYGLGDTVVISAFATAELTTAKAAGIQTLYFPPDVPSTGYDAASVAAALVGASAQGSHVGVNAVATQAFTGTVDGTANIVFTSGALISAMHEGALIYGPGVPQGTTLHVVDATHATLSQTANITASGQAYTVLPGPGYIASLAAAGFTVWAYGVNRRWTRDWARAAGAAIIVSDDPVYLAANAPVNKGSVSALSQGVWPHGLLQHDQARGRGKLNSAGVQQDYAGASGAVFSVVGEFAPITKASYTLSGRFVFDTLDSDTSRHADVYFCCPDDRVTNAQALAAGIGGSGLVDGYVLLLRETGVPGLFKNTRTAQTSSNVSPASGPALATAALAAGDVVDWSIAVAATTITVSLTVTPIATGIPTVYGPWVFNDSTFRGGYHHVGKVMSTGTKMVLTHKALAVV
jgi:glycerophosphoryl diester phosphodiesterase